MIAAPQRNHFLEPIDEREHLPLVSGDDLGRVSVTGTTVLAGPHTSIDSRHVKADVVETKTAWSTDRMLSLASLTAWTLYGTKSGTTRFSRSASVYVVNRDPFFNSPKRAPRSANEMAKSANKSVGSRAACWKTHRDCVSACTWVGKKDAMMTSETVGER